MQYDVFNSDTTGTLKFVRLDRALEIKLTEKVQMMKLLDKIEHTVIFWIIPNPTNGISMIMQ